MGEGGGGTKIVPLFFFVFGFIFIHLHYFNGVHVAPCGWYID